MEAHAALAAKWTDAQPLGMTEERVAEFERRHGMSIPADFRLYLLHAVPSQDYFDDVGVTWWSADRLKAIPDECGAAEAASWKGMPDNPEEYVIYADFLLWCYAYAVCCSPGQNRGRVALIGDKGGFVAANFSEFVQFALEDSNDIHIGASTTEIG